MRRTKYQPSSAEGDDYNTGTDLGGWRCLHFGLTIPQYYQYHYNHGGDYVVDRPSEPGPDDYEAAAIGDIDNDGTEAEFSMVGRVKGDTVSRDAQMFMKEELEWVRKNPKGRQAKSKARVQAFEELASTEFQKRSETQEIYIPPGPRLGDVVVEVKDVAKAYGDKVLYERLNYRVPRGAIVGIIGSNGMGKTTLFKMLLGEEKPTSGTIKIGETVKFASVSQSRDSLGGDNTVFNEIGHGHDLIKVGGYEMPTRAYLGRFNFKGEGQQKRVKELSGGERNRLHLAKVLMAGGNVVLLDEPTNDLDVETLRALEEALLDFPGCAVVISHDRWFLDRIATHILAFEGDSHVEWFEGNYQDYAADFKRRKGVDADQSHRIRFKPLAR